jgi:hypothetical protein
MYVVHFFMLHLYNYLELDIDVLTFSLGGYNDSQASSVIASKSWF